MPIDPSTLTNKRLWLRAKDLGAGGSTVTAWPDQSGQAVAMTLVSTAPTVAAAATPAGGKAVQFGAGYFTIASPGMMNSSATATANSETGGAASNTIDGDRNTFWESSSGSPWWIRLQLKTATVITGYTLTGRGGWTGRNPSTWVFQGSNDGATWVDLDSRSGQALGNNVPNHYVATNSTAYLYYRLSITKTEENGSIINLAEFALDELTVGVSASSEASNTISGGAAAAAIDGSSSTYWESTVTGPWWIKVRPQRPAIVTGYTLTGRSGWTGRSPGAWIFQGSNDETTWVDLDSRSGQALGNNVPTHFTFSNSTAYRYFRLYVSSTTEGGSVLDLAEMAIDGVTLQAAITTAPPGELWVVIKSGNTSNNGAWGSYGTDGNQSHYAYSGQFWDDFGSGSRQNGAAPVKDITQWRLLHIKSDGTWTAWIDETLQATVSTPITWPSTAVIGNGNVGGGLNFTGYIAEIMIRAEVSSPSTVADLITYFNTEHGLSVPGGSSGTSTPQSFTGAGVSFARTVALGTFTAGTKVPQSFTGAASSAAATAGLGSFAAGSKVSQSFTGTAVSISGTAPAGTFTAGNVKIPQAFTGTAAACAVTAGLGSFTAPHSGGIAFTGKGVTFGHTDGLGSFIASGTLPTIIEKARFHGYLTATTTLTFSAAPAAGDIVVIVQMSRVNNLPAATASGLGGTWTMQNGSSDPYGTNRVFISTNRTSSGTVTISGGSNGAADVLWLGYVIRGANPTVTVLPSPANPTPDEHGRGQVVIVTALETAQGTAGSGLDLPASESLPSPSSWTADSPYVSLDGGGGVTWIAGAATAIPTETGGYYADTNNFGNSAEFTQTRIAVGTYVNAQRFSGTGVVEGVTAGAGSFEAATSYSIGGTLTTSTVQVVTNVVTMSATVLNGGGTLTAGAPTLVAPMRPVTLGGGGTLIARVDEPANADPRHAGPQWRYVVTDLANTPLGELTDIQHDPVADGVNTPTTMKFLMSASDPARQTLIEASGPMTRKCQVWEGNRLLLWGPLLPDQQSDDVTAGYTIHDPSWWWRGGRRVIGRIPRLNLLRNGDFRQGLTYWTGGADSDSIPKSAPSVRVISEDFLEDSDGLDPIRALEITGVESVTEAELSSNAVFWPNLATFRPGGQASIEAVADKMPTTTGLKVTVVGHTANDGTGNGLGLSQRRADAAAAIIHAKRPGAVITTKGVGFYDPKPGFPIDSQAQRRVVISYDQTITAKSKQWERQTVEVTQPKEARYPLDLTVAAMLKVTDDWSVADANMTSVKIVVRRKSVPSKPWDDQLGVGSASISDTDPVDRWIPQTASATVPADGRPYLVDVYLYAPAARAEYTAVILCPDEELYFWGVDQALIFKGIAEHIQDPTFGHGDLGIDVRATPTGIKRDRTYPFREHMPADTALEEFAGLNRGMDYDTLMLPSGRVVLSTFYPQQGQHVDYVLAQGGNVAAATPERSREVASSIIMQAQDLGSYRAEAYARDTRALGGLLLEKVVTAEQGTPLNELREAARQELAWGKTTTTGYWLDIDPDSISDVLANTSKGDVVRLILDEPVQVDRLARIVNRERHPDSLRLLVLVEES